MSSGYALAFWCIVFYSISSKASKASGFPGGYRHSPPLFGASIVWPTGTGGTRPPLTPLAALGPLWGFFGLARLPAPRSPAPKKVCLPRGFRLRKLHRQANPKGMEAFFLGGAGTPPTSHISCEGYRPLELDWKAPPRKKPFKEQLVSDGLAGA